MDKVYTIDIKTREDGAYASYTSSLIPRIGEIIVIHGGESLIVQEVIYCVDNTKKEPENVHRIQINAAKIFNPL